MLAGAGAGAVYWLTVYPADVIKSKLQVDSYQRPIYKGTLDCAQQVCLLHLLLFTAEMQPAGWNWCTAASQLTYTLYFIAFSYKSAYRQTTRLVRVHHHQVIRSAQYRPFV